MSNQLLSCPFCGGEPRLVPEDYEDKHGRPEPHAECDHCDLAIPLHTWNRRATQPAAGEPIGKVELFGINMTYVEWRERKMPPLGTELYAAPPASAPVAAGEPVAWMYDTPNNGRQYSGKRLDHYWWDALKDSYVKGVPLYAAPPAAAHGDEAVRKDAERYRWVRRGSNGLALSIVANHSDAELDSEIDAAMRAQGDGGAA